MGLIIYIIIGLISTILPFAIEPLIEKRSDDSKFKKWWRNNIIGEYEE